MPLVNNMREVPSAKQQKEQFDDPNSMNNLSEQIAELTMEHQKAQARIARLQNLQQALGDTVVPSDVIADVMKGDDVDHYAGPPGADMADYPTSLFKLNLQAFDDVTVGDVRDNYSVHSGSTNCGIPSLPVDGDDVGDDATPRSVASLQSDRDVIDEQIAQLAREHQLTREKMRDLETQLHNVNEVRRTTDIYPIRHFFPDFKMIS